MSTVGRGRHLLHSGARLYLSPCPLLTRYLCLNQLTTRSVYLRTSCLMCQSDTHNQFKQHMVVNRLSSGAPSSMDHN